MAFYLIRDFGDDAEAELGRRMAEPGVPPEEMRRFRQTAAKMAELRRRPAAPGA